MVYCAHVQAESGVQTLVCSGSLLQSRPVDSEDQPKVPPDTAGRPRRDRGEPGKRKRRHASPAESELPVRDTKYYDEDGDCVIRVENVLFRVHRFTLSRSSEVLATLFQLPQGDLRPQGSSDANPIVLIGDTVRQFHAFLKYSLSPVMAIQIDKFPPGELIDVIAFGNFAHKYMMDSWLSLAMTLIEQYLKTVVKKEYQESDEDVDAILRPALLLAERAEDHPRAPFLWDSIPRAWIGRFGYDDGPDVRIALDAAVVANHRMFLVALYEMIIERQQQPESSVGMISFSNQGFASIHVQRLLTGAWSLSLLWNHLANGLPPSFPIPTRASCNVHSTVCIPWWQKTWDDNINAYSMTWLGPADVLGRLDALRKAVYKAAEGQHAPPCALRVLNSYSDPFKKLRKEVKASLGGYFFGDAGVFCPIEH
ncbi:hypothetical protein C8J57DRAFT_1273391 [Mycena rebaudengoi]|nr:hypothetical protein C8J57DRAFT_1273391 [Mycena rebaudengoi]